jgi:hypothetical protein
MARRLRYEAARALRLSEQIGDKQTGEALAAHAAQWARLTSSGNGASLVETDPSGSARACRRAR